MSHQIDFGIFGGDLRQVYMAETLLDKGYSVAVYGLMQSLSHKNCVPVSTLHDLFEMCKVLIGPIPMSRDQVTITANQDVSDLTIAHVAYQLSNHHILIGGNIPLPLLEICNSKRIPYYDLMQDENITIKNAIATAEGTIMEAIACSDRNLYDSNCLVLGYGRCAKVLARKLKALDARVTIAARRTEALAQAEADGHGVVALKNIKCILPSFHYIFNTIPSLILNQGCLELVNPSVTIIDIASAPGGVDFEYAKQHKRFAKSCLGLPGKVAPRSTAVILVTGILAYLKERSD
ncbi:MAG: dipicolinate synthase subunit DpsA [Clostridiales bacterium]|nr:dipicolinate synthase subunit DpsA [Clostridiales bacterium]